MSGNFELSSLYNYICRALTLTEAVKATLEFECTEARFALEPWHIRTVVTTKIDRYTCICDKVSSESQIEKISAGLERAILQTQKLRETLLYNTSEQEKRIKEPNLCKIYAPKDLPLDKTKLQTVYHKSYKIKTAKCSIKPLDNNVKKTQNTIKTVSISTTNKTIKVLSKSKKVSDSTIIKVDTKPKGKKNVLVANKLNIKNIKPGKVYDDEKKEEMENNSKMKPVICTASTNEITKLMEIISSSSFKEMSISSINTNCPLHGEISAQFTKEVCIQSLSIVDALYKLDIPKDILKVLKTYHLYLEHTKKTRNNLPHQKVTSFLKNENKQDYFIRNNITNLIIQSVSIFEKVYSGIIYEEQMKKLEKELEFIYKIYKIKKFDTDSIGNVKLFNPTLKYSEIGGWVSNGIWNSACIKDLRRISKGCCINYNSITQLSSFLEILQEFQQTEYFNTMIEILLRDIIPKTIHFFEPMDAKYLQIFKMVNILSQGLNPKNPVYVKTEE